MKKEFSFYEFVGIIAPGTVFLVILFQAFPEAIKVFDAKNLSLGAFGIFVIIAYTVGHLIQSIGNIIESLWWRIWGGMPTNWIINDKKCNYLSKEQLEALPLKITTVLSIEAKLSLSDYEPKQWFPITRQIYAAVKQANASERIDIFNGNYGFFRGIAAALAISLIMLIIKFDISNLWILLIIIASFVMAVARMHLFAKHYARELFVQFLQIKK
jgi:heme exporter protein D